MENDRSDVAQSLLLIRIVVRFLACAAALSTAALPVLAQLASQNQTPAQVEVSMRAQANSSNIYAWLGSKDPRLIAWGAYFARESSDTAALELAAHLVKLSLDQGGPDLIYGSGLRSAALSEVLDALIEKDVPLPPELLGYVSRSYPIQALILLSRLSPDERRANLMQWYGGAQPNGSPALSRVAAMLLSHSPPPGFAASILGNSEEKLIVHITVPIEGMKIGFGSNSANGGLCADYGLAKPLPGWPDLFYYRLHENDRSSVDPLLVEAGGDRVTWERAPSGRFRSCSEVGSLNAETRHHLLAELLGERDEAIPWRTQKDVTIESVTDDQVKREIGATILAEQAILHRSVQDFQKKGLINADEAKTVLPALSITIKYEGSLRRQE